MNLKTRARLAFPKGVEATVRCWPIALTDTRALAIATSASPAWSRVSPRCSFGGLTSFFAVEPVSVGDQSAAETFVLHARSRRRAGGPRTARCSRGCFGDPAKVIRYLRMLLAATRAEASDLDGVEGDVARAATGLRRRMAGDIRLLEVLLRAFDRDPQRLDLGANLIAELLAASGQHASAARGVRRRLGAHLDRTHTGDSRV